MKANITEGVPGGSDGKESACSAGDLSLISGSGRSPGEGDGYPLQYFCPENSVGRGALCAIVRGVTKSFNWVFSSSCGLGCMFYLIVLVWPSEVDTEILISKGHEQIETA